MKYVMSLISVFALGLFIFFSEKTKSALPVILEGISQTVLCTIFPANLLLRLISFSPLGEKISNKLTSSRIWQRTHLSPVYLPSVISGQLSGIPTGASLLSGVNGKNRHKALALSSIVSPAFICAVLKSPSSGLLLYFNLVEVLWCVSFFLPSEKEEAVKLTVEKITFPKALAHATESAVAVAGAMIFFSLLLTTLPDKAPHFVREWLSAALEVGTAGRVCENPIPLAAALSFGGLSALSQISFSLEGISLKYYLISRVFLFFPCLFFLIFPKMRILQTLFTSFFLITQIYRKNS